MMMHANCTKSVSDTDRDSGDTRWSDGYGNSRGDEQTVRSTNIINRDMGISMCSQTRVQGTDSFGDVIYSDSSEGVF